MIMWISCGKEVDIVWFDKMLILGMINKSTILDILSYFSGYSVE